VQRLYLQLENNVVLATQVDPRATKGEDKNGAGDFMWGLVFGDGRFRGSFSGLVFGMSMSGEIRGPDSGRFGACFRDVDFG
jgi:hypothetical protein